MWREQYSAGTGSIFPAAGGERVKVAEGQIGC